MSARNGKELAELDEALRGVVSRAHFYRPLRDSLRDPDPAPRFPEEHGQIELLAGDQRTAWRRDEIPIPYSVTELGISVSVDLMNACLWNPGEEQPLPLRHDDEEEEECAE